MSHDLPVLRSPGRHLLCGAGFSCAWPPACTWPAPPRPSGWLCGQRRPGGFDVPGSGKAAAGGLPGGGVLEDQILADLGPAEREELSELVLIRFAVDAAADDDVRGDALIPCRALDDQALDFERWVRQQAPEPLEPAP